MSDTEIGTRTTANLRQTYSFHSVSVAFECYLSVFWRWERCVLSSEL